MGFTQEDVLAALSAREPIFHRRAFGTTRDALEAMTHADFHEIGASGARYGRSYAIETMLERYKEPEPHDGPCRDFMVTAVADDAWLLSYTLEEPGRITQRSTIWVWQDQRWQILFHQGTVV